MTPTERAAGRLRQLSRHSWVAGIAGGACCLAGVFVAREQFFLSYLFAYLFWIGIAVGCLGLLLLHNLTGGAWGDIIRPVLRAGSLTLPWFLLFLIPIAFGLKGLYPWTLAGSPAADPALQHNHVYLNVPFFAFRAFFYLAAWSVLAFGLDRGRFARGASGAGLVLYFVTVTFAIVDWMMSMEPPWTSTVYEAMVLMGWVLAGLAFAIVLLRFLRPEPEVLGEEEPKPLLDLGNMVLAFVMFWAYMNFSQYLIIWSGNIPDEISWYLHRQGGGWFWVAMALILFQFFVPFLLLLSRNNKRRLHRLNVIAGILLGVQLLDLFWLVEPAVYRGRFHLHWLDFAAPIAVGGFWLAALLKELRPEGLVP